MIARLCQVCHGWRAALQATPELWRRVDATRMKGTPVAHAALRAAATSGTLVQVCGDIRTSYSPNAE